MVQRVRFGASSAMSVGSIPGPGKKILPATQHIWKLKKCLKSRGRLDPQRHTEEPIV